MDLEQLISDIKDAASKILKQDITVLRGYSERQLEAIAQQAEFVSVGIASRQITKETEQFFLDGLEDMALSFAKTLRGLLMVTIEKVWNAIVGVLWTAISKAAGVALPVPLIT
ncbi:TPA: hypothetical protein I4G69_004895 [Enterobacter asburiae]|nr:hypothetical protein [Enterobacter asburiae]